MRGMRRGPVGSGTRRRRPPGRLRAAAALAATTLLLPVGGAVLSGSAAAQTTCGGSMAVAPGQAIGVAAHAGGSCPGYWVLTTAGSVVGFGSAPDLGSVPARELAAPATGLAATADRKGYWVVDGAGQVFRFGDAASYGQPRTRPAWPIVAITPTPDGRGYWLLDRRGGVYPFGDAARLGGVVSAVPAVALVADRTAPGYWVVDEAGRVRAFGAARWLGDPRGRIVNRVVGALADGTGYALVTAGGGVWSYGGAAISWPAPTRGLPVAAAAAVPGAAGAWLLTEAGRILPAGAATALGSVGETSPVPVDRLAYLPATATQVVIDRGDGWQSTYGVLQAYAYGPYGWTASFPAMSADNGWKGWELGQNRREGDGSSPTGIFPIEMDRLFGNAADPGGLHAPYTHIVNGDYWDENPSSPQYNQFVVGPTTNAADCNSGDNAYGGDTECLWQEAGPYPYFANILFNPPPTHNPIGAGIFLHAQYPSPGADTAGCISLVEPQLLEVLRWLQPGAHPVMVMGPNWSSY